MRCAEVVILAVSGNFDGDAGGGMSKQTTTLNSGNYCNSCHLPQPLPATAENTPSETPGTGEVLIGAWDSLKGQSYKAVHVIGPDRR